MSKQKKKDATKKNVLHHDASNASMAVPLTPVNRDLKPSIFDNTVMQPFDLNIRALEVVSEVFQESIIENVEKTISFNQLLKKMKPISVKQTVNLCEAYSLLSVTNPDSRADDKYLRQDNSMDTEP